MTLSVQETISGAGSIADPFIFQDINIDSVRVNGVEAKLTYQHENGFRVPLCCRLCRW